MKVRYNWLCECGHKKKEHVIDWGKMLCEGIIRFKHGYCECKKFKLDNFWFVKTYGKKAKKKC